MLEFLRHAFGLCGEHWHPNIWTFLLGGLGFHQAFSYVKYKLKKKYDKSQSRTIN